MIKFIGAIMIVFAGAICGAAASEKLRSRRTACNILIEAVNQISVMINYRGLTFYEIASELKSQPQLSGLGFINGLPEKYDGISGLSVKWNDALENDEIIGDEEKSYLRSFAASIGSSDKDGQLSGLELLRQQLESAEKKREEEYRRKGKLYRSIGVLAGVMAGIMLI